MPIDVSIAPVARPAATTPNEAVLRWLIPLRFLATAGLAAALLAAERLLALPLPYPALWRVALLLLATNLALRVAQLRALLPASRAVVPVLLLDCALFTYLLHASGGPDNPFSALYVILVAAAAMTGSAAATWTLAVASTLAYALVFRWHETQHFWHGPVSPAIAIPLHAVGMWIAVVVVAVAITYFIGHVLHSLRERDAELIELGEVAARNTRLASLTTLAAGAAHELGSPLGTIAIVARELERAASAPAAPPSLADDARLLRSEVERCRSILDRMRSRAAEETRGAQPELRAEEALAALRAELGDASARRVVGELRVPAACSLGPRSDFLGVVLPIVRNALDASPERAEVRLEVSLDAGRLRVVTRDEGHGMDAETLARAGEPFFTTRSPGSGTGLGLFVVNLEVERLGGSLRLRSTPGRGTTAIVEWPLAGLAGARDEAPAEPPRAG